MTSVRNPSRPRFTPSSGTPCRATSRAAYSSVPSPPIAIMRSARSPSWRSGTRAAAAAVGAASSLTSTCTPRPARYGSRVAAVSATRGSPKRPTRAQLRTGNAMWAKPYVAPRQHREAVLFSTVPLPWANAQVAAAARHPRVPCAGSSLDARRTRRLAFHMVHEGRDEALGERAQHLLRILVETYIRDGQPVGSRALSRESGLQLSSATVRNVMADLEELGFVSSPHTSAGRVPTDKGYRFFVDTLLQLRPPDEAASAEMRRQFEVPHDSPTELIATASQLLSTVTRLAGVVTLPLARPHRRHPDRVRGAVGEPGAGGTGVQRPRGAEPHHPARAALLARRARARLQLPQRAVPRPLAARGAPGDPAAAVRGARAHEPDHAGCDHRRAAGVRGRGRGASRVRHQGRDQPDGCRRADAAWRSSGGCSRHSTRSATSCTCSTRASRPKACRSSSATSRAIRSSTTAAW